MGTSAPSNFDDMTTMLYVIIEGHDHLHKKDSRWFSSFYIQGTTFFQLACQNCSKTQRQVHPLHTESFSHA